ncbi:MAG TPA: HAD family hydrolase [Polyangiales bacterium]|nr:HAD family hydrolase [Polyangiales bacterium]
MASIVPRLIASDLDGTLLRSDSSASPRTKHVLRALAARGVHVVLVTGRPFRRVRGIARDLQLSGTAICANGALLYDLARDEVLEQTTLSADVAHALIHQLREKLPDICFAVETGRSVAREAAYARHRPTQEGAEAVIADAIELSARGASKLIAMHPTLPLEEFFESVREIVADRASVTHAGSPFLEIAAAGVTKAWALAALCERLQVAPREVIAFGDMPNDLPMLEWAGRGVAVRNAHPSVLAAATAITLSNDEDGVADYLERYI